MLVVLLFTARELKAMGPWWFIDNNDYFDCVVTKNSPQNTGYYAECPYIKDEIENCADPIPDYVFTGYMFWACYDYCDNPDNAYWYRADPQMFCYMAWAEPRIERWFDQCQVTCACQCEGG